ncbi:MAG TPA: response regulator, partial [Rhodanobacteraceae bacterium]|nr:response regulator [Rhodanobacteraceae bacterium]
MPTDRSPVDPSSHPLVLVAEDDGPSGQFFISAFQDMHCQVDLATTGQQALRLARNQAYSLLLLDCHMPDFGATRILSALREDPAAASHACPAIATSAELDPVEQAHFRRIGFADALLKPVSLETLRQSVKTWLPAMPSESVLDDSAAIASSGSAASVAALRELFIRELSRLLCELDQLAQNGGLSETLHRLLASCG